MKRRLLGWVQLVLITSAWGHEVYDRQVIINLGSGNRTEGLLAQAKEKNLISDIIDLRPPKRVGSRAEALSELEKLGVGGAVYWPEPGSPGYFRFLRKKSGVKPTPQDAKLLTKTGLEQEKKNDTQLTVLRNLTPQSRVYIVGSGAENQLNSHEISQILQQNAPQLKGAQKEIMISVLSEHSGDGPESFGAQLAQSLKKSGILSQVRGRVGALAEGGFRPDGSKTVIRTQGEGVQIDPFIYSKSHEDSLNPVLGIQFTAVDGKGQEYQGKLLSLFEDPKTRSKVLYFHDPRTQEVKKLELARLDGFRFTTAVSPEDHHQDQIRRVRLELESLKAELSALEAESEQSPNSAKIRDNVSRIRQVVDHVLTQVHEGISEKELQEQIGRQKVIQKAWIETQNLNLDAPKASSQKDRGQSELRKYLMEQLAQDGKPEKAFARFLSYSDLNVQYEARSLLKEFPGASGIFDKLLKSKDKQVRRNLATAMASIQGVESDDQVRWFKKLLQDKDTRARRSGFISLVHLDPAQKDAVFEKLLKDPDVNTRVEAQRALARTGDTQFMIKMADSLDLARAKGIHEAFVAYLKPQQRIQHLSALARMNGSTVQKLLSWYLRDVPPQELVPILVDLFQRGGDVAERLKDLLKVLPDPKRVAQVVQRLTSLDQDQAKEWALSIAKTYEGSEPDQLFRALLSDPNEAVRNLAGQALAEYEGPDRDLLQRKIQDGTIVAHDPNEIRLDGKGSPFERVDYQTFGDCYSQAATKLIEFELFSKHGQDRSQYRISSLISAIERERARPAEDRGIAIRQPFESGKVEKMIRFLRKKGACQVEESDVASRVEESLDKRSLFEDLYLLYREYHDSEKRKLAKIEGLTREELLRQAICHKYDDLSEPIEGILMEIEGLQRDLSYSQFLKQILGCQNHPRKDLSMIPEQISKKIWSRGEFKKLVRKLFKDAEPPQPMGIDFCATLLKSLRPNYVGILPGSRVEKPDCGRHAAVVMGYRNRGGNEEVLVYDTSGIRCSGVYPDCEVGKIWMGIDRLGDNVYWVNYFPPN